MSRLSMRSATLAAAAARLSYSVLRHRPPGGAELWSRTNHRGDSLTLLEGPAAAIGAVAGSLAAPGLTGRARAAMTVAGLGAAALGSYDDLAGDGSSRGFRGHLGALRRGELTTGAVKLAGIGVTGLAASALLGRDPAGRGASGSAVAGSADFVINAGLVAGAANLLNLFDLRPGRAIKVTLGTGALLAAVPGPGRSAVAAPLGAAAALLPEDLGERAMLGDGGANALGAMLGTAAAAGLSRPARLATLAVIVGLTATSEVVSFTKDIERTAPLRWVDMLGRRPVPAPAATPQPAAAAADRPAGPQQGGQHHGGQHRKGQRRSVAQPHAHLNGQRSDGEQEPASPATPASQ